MSSLPNLKAGGEIVHLDKVLHTFEYMPFGYLMARAFDRALTVKLRHFIVLYAFLGSLAYGISDEYHQSFVMGRSADAIDAVFDTFGGLLGAVIYVCLTKTIKE